MPSQSPSKGYPSKGARGRSGKHRKPEHCKQQPKHCWFINTALVTNPAHFTIQADVEKINCMPDRHSTASKTSLSMMNDVGRFKNTLCQSLQQSHFSLISINSHIKFIRKILINCTRRLHDSSATMCPYQNISYFLWPDGHIGTRYNKLLLDERCRY